MVNWAVWKRYGEFHKRTGSLSVRLLTEIFTVIFPNPIKPLEGFINHGCGALMFYCLPAVGKRFTLRERKDTEKSSEDPFVQLQQPEPPSPVLEQVCIPCRLHLNSTPRTTPHNFSTGKFKNCWSLPSFVALRGWYFISLFPLTGLHGVVAHNLSILCTQSQRDQYTFEALAKLRVC